MVRRTHGTSQLPPEQEPGTISGPARGRTRLLSPSTPAPHPGHLCWASLNPHCPLLVPASVAGAARTRLPPVLWCLATLAELPRAPGPRLAGADHPKDIGNCVQWTWGHWPDSSSPCQVCWAGGCSAGQSPSPDKWGACGTGTSLESPEQNLLFRVPPAQLPVEPGPRVTFHQQLWASSSQVLRATGHLLSVHIF